MPSSFAHLGEDCGHIVLVDDVYHRIYDKLTHGHRFVALENKLMVVLEDGAMLGIMNGKRRPVCKHSTHSTLTLCCGLINKKGHAYLNRVVKLAYKKGLPLHDINLGIDYDAPGGPKERHLIDANQKTFDDPIDTCRAFANVNIHSTSS